MAKKTADGIEILNTSQIAMRVGLNRATVRQRLLDLGVDPVERKAKENLYAFTDDLQEQLNSETKPLDLVKLRKETADAEMRELNLAKTKGEMVAVADFSAVVQQLFGAMHKKCAVQLPKQLAKKVANSKNESEIAKIVANSYAKVFDDLRSDYKKFLDPKLTQSDPE